MKAARFLHLIPTRLTWKPNNRLEADHLGSAVGVGLLLDRVSLLLAGFLPISLVAAQPER